MRNTLYNLIISRLASFVKGFSVFFANIYDVFLHSCNVQTSFCPFVVIYAYKKKYSTNRMGISNSLRGDGGEDGNARENDLHAGTIREEQAPPLQCKINSVRGWEFVRRGG